jgi:hypothetical protein
MVFFHSYVSLPEGRSSHPIACVGHQIKHPVGPSSGAAIAAGRRAGRHEAPRELRLGTAEDTVGGDAKPGVQG